MSLLARMRSDPPRKETIQIYGSSCTFTKAPEFSINHKSIEKADLNKNLGIEAETVAGEASSAELHYKDKDSSEFTKLEMTKGEGNKYTATIAKEKLSLKGLEYYIVAKCKDKEAKTDTYSVRIINGDVEPPEICDLQPAENSKVDMEALTSIKVSFKSEKNINKDSIKMFLDDKDITLEAKKIDNSVEYTPT